MKKNLTLLLLLVVMVLIALLITSHSQTRPQVTTTDALQQMAVLYSCNGGKNIQATFSETSEARSVVPSVSGTPPIPKGRADLILSDGRALALSQTLSASGVRYSNPDESFVFWSKGNGALVLENNQEKSYIGCVRVAFEPAGTALVRIYSNSHMGFSLRLLKDYGVDESYRYQALGPGKEISGIRFSIPSSVASGTNLSNDSYISVEELPKVENCSADLFVGNTHAPATMLTEGDSEYSVASVTDAAAGNRYEETVYALPGTNPCMAVRYFIHYGAIENYPAGIVKEFNKKALTDEFDKIRRTLVVAQ